MAFTDHFSWKFLFYASLMLTGSTHEAFSD